MHKPFYVSGFLYHGASQQILMYQPHINNDEPMFWRMLGGESVGNEIAEKALQRIIYKLLNLRLPLNKILMVYDYFHPTRKKNHYVFYAQINTLRPFRFFSQGKLSWFTFKQAMKLPLATETKQDIIVAERVIRAENETRIPRTVSLQK